MFGIDDSLIIKDIDLFIAKPSLNREIIGHLTEAYGATLNLKMGNLSELAFSVPYKVERKHDIVDNPNIEKLRDRFFIKAIYDNKEEWFRIDNLTKSSNEDGEVLNIHAYSLGIELGDKMVQLVDETSKDVKYMLEFCLSETLWSVGHIDTDIESDEKGHVVYRSFDITETTKLDFLYTIAETYQGVVVWDTINRAVSLRTQDNVGSNKSLRISYGQYMKSLDKESNSNEMVTRLIPTGQDGLTIHSVSPTGQGYIDDFSYFLYPFQRDENKNVISQSIYMSDELCHALLDYSELLKANDGRFQQLLENRTDINTQLSSKNAELVKLDMGMNQILDSIDIEKANNRDYSKLETQRLELQSQIDALKIEISNIEAQLKLNQTEINNLQKLLSTESNFTPEQIMELNTYIIEKNWSNEYIINPEDLIKEAKKEFETLRKPQTVFTIDIVDFTQLLEGQKDWGKLNIGDTVYIYHERLNENITAKIIEMDVDFDNQSVNLTIANTKDILTAEEKLYERLYDADMTSTTVNVNKYRWKNDSDKVSEIERLVNGYWDATKRRIVAGTNESVIIDERGMRIINPDYPNEMLIGQAGILSVSDSGGDDWKHAITSKGIVAENIYGKLGVFAKIRSDQIVIDPDGTEKEFGDKLFDVEVEVQKYANDKDSQLRKDLRLENPLPSSMRLNNLGLHVDDQNGNNRVRLGQYATGKYGLLIRNKSGNATILDEDGIMQTWQEGRTDNVDSSNPLTLYVYIPPETRLIRKSILRFKLLPFRAYSRGTSSDGSYSTSTSSGGGVYTSTGSGGGEYTSTESGGYVNKTTGDSGVDVIYGTAQTDPSKGDADKYNHTHTYREVIGHKHYFEVPSHSHGVYLPSHSHSISISDHTHSVYIPPHSHGIDYGIYTSTTPYAVTIYINGYNRTYNLGGSFNTDQSNLDITSYLNIGQWNTIELGSSRLGRLDATVFVQAFIGM